MVVEDLAAAGLPHWLLQYAGLLYEHNRCRLVVDGSTHEGFTAAAGIRQGCPLSPILFAVAMDILLRRLGRTVPGITTRAFADDVAAVVRDLAVAAPLLHSVFVDVGRLSGLHLNLPKTFMVPLFLGERA